MYIRPLSDVHNEFSVMELPELETDKDTVLVLSGDIAVAVKAKTTLAPFLEKNSERFRAVLYTPGNHEYYHGSLITADAKLEGVCRRYSNVHFMQGTGKTIDDIHFIGATLWTDFNKADAIAMLYARTEMNDYNIVRTGPKNNPYGRRASPEDTFSINKQHREAIESELSKAAHAGLKSVVFTHHTPTMLSNSGHYPVGPLDYAYHNTGLEEMIFTYEPLVWIYGHTHHPMDYMLGRTRMLSNQRGYTRDPYGDEGLGFNNNLVIEPIRYS